MRTGAPFAAAVALVAALSCVPFAPVRAAEAPKDRVALEGLRAARAIFDVRVADKEKLTFNLELIKETFEGMRKQGVSPAMIVTFRGPGVRLLTRAQAAEWNASLVSEMKALGIRFEVCAVAARVFKVDTATLIPDVVLVGNVLTSLIGYQNKGYALIPVY
jgi:intracellular sulfur oxidation DsrE/DsrF family protein